VCNNSVCILRGLDSSYVIKEIIFHPVFHFNHDQTLIISES
jgi:hypothetical protein